MENSGKQNRNSVKYISHILNTLTNLCPLRSFVHATRSGTQQSQWYSSKNTTSLSVVLWKPAEVDQDRFKTITCRCPCREIHYIQKTGKTFLMRCVSECIYFSASLFGNNRYWCSFNVFRWKPLYMIINVKSWNSTDVYKLPMNYEENVTKAKQLNVNHDW